MDKIGHRRLQFIALASCGLLRSSRAVPALTRRSHPLSRSSASATCSRVWTEHDDVRTSSEVFRSTCARRDTAWPPESENSVRSSVCLGAPTRRPYWTPRTALRRRRCRSTGFLLTNVLPETAGRSLEEISGEGDHLPTQEAAPAQVP